MHTSTQWRPQCRLSAQHCHRNKEWCNGGNLQIEVRRHGRAVESGGETWAPLLRWATNTDWKSQNSAEVNRWHLVDGQLPHLSFSGVHCCLLRCHWNTQVAEFPCEVGKTTILYVHTVNWFPVLVCAGSNHQRLSISNGCNGCPHFTGLMNVYFGNWEFAYMGYMSLHNCNCAYQCVSSKNTDAWSAFWQELFTRCRFTCPALC